MSAAVEKRSTLAGAHALTRNLARTGWRSGRIVLGSITGAPRQGPGIGERVAAIAEELVEQDADGEKIGGDIPAIQAGVRWLIGRRTRLGMHGIADPRGDVEVEQLRSRSGEQHVLRLDVAVDQPSVLQFRPFTGLGFRQVAVASLGVQLLEACRIRVKGDERVEQVKRDVDGLPVAQAPVPGDEFVKGFPVEEFGDEIPLADAGLAGPEYFHYVGVLDFPAWRRSRGAPPRTRRRCRRA